MSDKTGIQWTDATWNPIRGCSRVSEGCRNCYAETVAARFSGPGQAYEGLARRTSTGEARWTGKIMFVEKHLDDPLRWRTPKRIFVNSMSDLFHEGVTDEQLDMIFAVMAIARRHTFQILTKRPERMRDYLSSPGRAGAIAAETGRGVSGDRYWPFIRPDELAARWPLPNVWLGVSVEDQDAADERIPLLLLTPAVIRFLSCEPLLGPIALIPESVGGYPESVRWADRGPDSPRIDWVIVGGESGPKARRFDMGWARDLVAQCYVADVACFVKQMGSNPVDPWADTAALVNGRESVVPSFRDSHGGNPSEWPIELRVRDFPAVTA